MRRRGQLHKTDGVGDVNKPVYCNVDGRIEIRQPNKEQRIAFVAAVLHFSKGNKKGLNGKTAKALIILWYRGPESNRHGIATTGF